MFGLSVVICKESPSISWIICVGVTRLNQCIHSFRQVLTLSEAYQSDLTFRPRTSPLPATIFDVELRMN